MSLSIGIVGLPNVGKSTLFNALLKRQVALAANYPFATIEPNIGIVDVPDARLNVLADIVRKEYSKPNEVNLNIPEKITPATIKFYDIAGLVKGASEGEGLGNQFLSHIRETDAIVQVVRDFADENVIREGSTNPATDIEVINTELILADLQTLEKRLTAHQNVLKKDKTTDNEKKQELYVKLQKTLDSGNLANTLAMKDDEKILVKDLSLLTQKPMFYILNINENQINAKNEAKVANGRGHYISLSAKIESELCSLSDEDRIAYMHELGMTESGLDKVIKYGFELLGLQTFLTAGPTEVRAWTIAQGDTAPKAAGKIHTDFEKGFIKAQIVSYNDLVTSGSFKVAQERGLLRLEGKSYIMQDGDVVEFRFNV